MILKDAILSFFLIINLYTHPAWSQKTEEEMKTFLEEQYEPAAVENCKKLMEAQWNAATDSNNQNYKDELKQVTNEVAKSRLELWEENFKDLDLDSYADDTLKRQLKSLMVLGSSALDPDDLEKYTTVKSEMSSTYSTAKICPFGNEDCDPNTEGLSLEPDIEDIMSSSTNYEELTYAWKAWRDASGAKIRTSYSEYIRLSNEVAIKNEFDDMGAMWRDRFETDNFIQIIDELWEQVEPLYDQLHTYVRRKLQTLYGDQVDMSDGLIPANILGNMWAQSWVNIEPHVRPYPDASEVDVTEAMKDDDNIDVNWMFDTANKFYTSMGLEDCSMSYNDEAMITKPPGKEVLCHASAWDFCDGRVRIKMCTDVNMEDFITVHHELGHIQYYRLYRDKPITFRGGANPGFHEAVGDTIALSASTPQHLQKIELLPDYVNNEESSINALMRMALERVAFLPFGLLIDKWRWNVFSGNIQENEWNKRWWDYREQYQKIKPPVARTEDDFDPGAKYHVAGDSQYISYFVARILQFQFYKSLCITAGEYDPDEPDSKPLHECDFYEDTDAGAKLKLGLELGSSLPWPDALEEITGQRVLDASALLEYFKPLQDFLEEQNRISLEKELTDFLEEQYYPELQVLSTAETQARWNHQTDINDENKEALDQAILDRAAFLKKHWEEVFQHQDEENYNHPLSRQLKFLKLLGNAVLDDARLSEFNDVKTTMTDIYNKAKICPYNNQDCNVEEEGLSLEPDIEAIMATSEDYDQLTWVWKAWRDATGKKILPSYSDYVTISNEVADENGFADMGEMWRSRFETENFIETIDNLWKEVEPLYDDLHTYVSRKLKEKYGDKIDVSDGFIPANILGNMWAQSWVNIEPFVTPFPGASKVDVTQAMQDNDDIDVTWMFEESNRFYLSMGLEDSSMSYDDDAMITKPSDKEVQCHASAWDFSDGETFRIKMCTEVNMEDFITVHHEMGHIQYFLLYKDQPLTFRTGANPGFHEAVGDTIALSVATPQHLEKIGLLSDYEDNYESSINALMNMALERVAFLPFGLLIDKWRWDVFSGNVEENEWNDRWWEYRKLYQKVKAPIDRNVGDFDPGAKYHVAGDSQYISYFVAHILEFQLYKSLCIAADEYDPEDAENKPLQKCDFYQSEAAGNKLRAGLELGLSEHWSVALEHMTGETKLDASALLEYFKPLQDYLREQNARNIPEAELAAFIEDEYNLELTRLYTAEVDAEWNYATDMTSEHENALNQAILDRAAFEREHWENLFQYLHEEDYQDEILRRQVKFLNVLGNAALDDEQLTELNGAISSMTDIYSNAAICPYDDQNCASGSLTLEPDIEGIMSSSTDYDQLLYAWEAWRSVSGAQMRDQFRTYVTLSNAAAKANGFPDMGSMWLNSFESTTFVDDIDKLWEDVEPLYKELHFYVSRKLKTRYQEDLDLSDHLIPAHVLGNMWAQSWINLASLVAPFPNIDLIDVTSALQSQDYTVERMFETANEFYESLELEDTSMSFGSDAMITKPEDKDVVCHASAWDFYDQTRFRVKMCTVVDYEDFITIHHELGHIQYFIQYKDQPITLRTGANPGFHEAVGDTIALSVATPKHLKEIGLLPDYEESREADINALMNMALERVAFLPFGLLIDKWRWDVFSGQVKEEEWNQHWWHYRETIQRVKAPVERTEEHFDPGAKFHVAADYQYISYFVAHILEFQFYKALCIEAEQYNPETKDPPLHKCDYYNSPAAGQLLKDALSLGASKHWTEVLEILTKETKMDASALYEYFEPLYLYLQEQNRNIPPEELILLLGDFDKGVRRTEGSQANVDWNFETNIGSADFAAAQVQSVLDSVAFRRSWLEVFESLNVESYTEDITRQLDALEKLGDAELGDTKLAELRSAINAMKMHHGTAKVCRFSSPQCNPLTQGINQEVVQDLMARSTVQYAELEFLWNRWRAAGDGARENFKIYVGLANEAAKARGFEDRGDQWRSEFGISSEDVEALWGDVEPLYIELHTFVINKLQEEYPDDWNDDIPAPLFGSIWSDSWYNLASLVRPYSEAGSIDVAGILEEKQLIDVFTQTNKFFLSLGLKDMSQVYETGGNSIIARPSGSDMSCQPSAWNFHDGEEYRVKICTTPNREGYVAAHRILSHIQYFLQYEDQPTAFRSAANQALYEAVGGAFALSAVALQHFAAIDWVTEIDETEEAYMNMLMDVALERVAALPFALAMDKWRWDVFSEEISETEWNEHWWQYRKIYQNISSPTEISNEGFDLGTRYEIIADEQIGSYFALGILEFQIYRALCIKAGKYDPETKDPPLYQCDFYDSSEVGELLQEALSAGSSKDWSEVLEIITGETAVNATAVLEYFDPLYEYLKENNSAVLQKFSIMLYLCSFFIVYYIPRLLW